MILLVLQVIRLIINIMAFLFIKIRFALENITDNSDLRKFVSLGI